MFCFCSIDPMLARRLAQSVFRDLSNSPHRVTSGISLQLPSCLVAQPFSLRSGESSESNSPHAVTQREPLASMAHLPRLCEHEQHLRASSCSSNCCVRAWSVAGSEGLTRSSRRREALVDALIMDALTPGGGLKARLLAAKTESILLVAN